MISYLPVYDTLFDARAKQPDFSSLNSSEAELKSSVKRLPVDFSVQNSSPKDYRETLKKIQLSVLQVFLLPWGLYELSRFIIQRLIMIPMYPAQSTLATTVIGMGVFAITSEGLDEWRAHTGDALNKQGCVRHVVLEKDGVRYSGLLIGHRDTISNGNWVIQAGGNLEFMEHSAAEMAATYRRYGYNTLLVNGPAVGKSWGHATPQSMGEAQRLGIQFLETALRAKRLVLAGRSLGGAAIGQAILQHDFKKDIDYLVVRQMTFDTSSHICSKVVAQAFPALESWVASLVKWAGVEMDSVAASRKLQDLGITEVIVQASSKEVKVGTIPDVSDFQTDGPIIAEASLGYRLVKEGITRHKVFHCLPNADHMTHDAVIAAEKEIRHLYPNKLKSWLWSLLDPLRKGIG